MKRIAVIGAGAGGMFFAADFFHEDAETVVLEASQTPMQKVLLSGGGRCNFTNLNIDAQKPENFYPRGARFLRMPLRRFDAQNAVEFFESLGVESKVEDEGRVFPQSDKSQDIADALMGRAEKNGAKIILGAKVFKISKDAGAFSLAYTQGGKEKYLAADFVVLASGGRWDKSLQSSLEELGVKFISPVPSLFSLSTGTSFAPLSGLSVEAKLTAFFESSGEKKKIAAQGSLLFTHFGLGGPAALKLSSFAARDFFEYDYKAPVEINLIPNFDIQKAREKFQAARVEFAKKMVKNTPMFNLPPRLWEWVLQESQMRPDAIWANLPKGDSEKILQNLFAMKANVTGKSPHKGEFVTCGGADCAQIDTSTMAFKADSRLFFLGECLDIDGITGGFNLQAAWTTAKTCSSFIKNKLNIS